MSKVLVVEDNHRLADFIRRALENISVSTDTAASLSSAEFMMGQCDYSALVLDRGMPDGDGLALLKRLRASGRMLPCLVLTAQAAIHDRVTGLEAGADDYLGKPFEMVELVARVKAMLRRPAEIKNRISIFGDLELDLEASLLIRGDKSVLLAPAEQEVLEVLMLAGESTTRRTKLEQAAWGLNNPVTPNALDVALHRIRKKLIQLDSNISILNIRGVGYALQKNAENA